MEFRGESLQPVILSFLVVYILVIATKHTIVFTIVFKTTILKHTDLI